MPKRRFGQNFLIDANILRSIVAAGNLTSGDQVIEIGTGLGVLTQALASVVGPTGKVLTFEVDESLVPVLVETLTGLSQVELLVGDAMDADMSAIHAANFDVTKPVTVVANIPYNITTPLLVKMLKHKTWVKGIVFLVQREVANRLIAKAGTPDYGSLSVFAQYHAKVEFIAPVSKKVFIPVPDVESAIVRLLPSIESPFPDIDEELFFKVVRASFGQRRKNLLNSLSGDPALGWTREQAGSALAGSGVDSARRGETLNLDEYAAIARSFTAGPTPPSVIPEIPSE
jgi:16S rRNA (adenine1518-N6/adenine1519-N6)-dimethyltransferase